MDKLTLFTKQNLIWIVVVICIFLSFQGAYDPDMGWHLATGKFIETTRQLPKTDPFSYSMSQHLYIAHSWLTDIILWALYNWGGFWAISLFYSVLTTIGIVILLKVSKLKNEWRALILLLVPIIVDIVGQRPQAITFIGLSSLLYFFDRWRLQEDKQPFFEWITTTKSWLIPILFLVWANTHGGVVLGLSVFGLGILVHWLARIYQTKKFQIDKTLLFQTTIFVVTFIASLINPYTTKIYEFGLGMIGNSTALRFNSDWVPLLSSLLPPETWPIRLSLIGLYLLAVTTGKQKLEFKILASILLLMSLKSIRFILVLIVILVPMVLLTIDDIRQRLSKTNKAISEWIPSIVIALVCLIVVIDFSHKQQIETVYQNLQSYGKEAELPTRAVEYIRFHQIPTNIFNFYTWGGYLDWQLPNHKVFIDGRMDNFFLNGNSFMTEFIAIDQMQLGWYEKLLSYGTQAALLPPNWRVIDALKTQYGWEEIYRDEMSVLLLKPNGK
jgi:hypothetical protein